MYISISCSQFNKHFNKNNLMSFIFITITSCKFIPYYQYCLKVLLCFLQCIHLKEKVILMNIISNTIQKIYYFFIKLKYDIILSTTTFVLSSESKM